MKFLAKHLLSPESSNLQSLCLYSNPLIGDEGIKILIDALCSSPHCKLHTLNLTETGIGIPGVKELTRYLRMNTALTILVLSRNKKIGDEGMKILCEALADNTTLNIMYCHGSGVNFRGGLYIESLLTSYRHSSHLSSIQIEDSGIGIIQRERMKVMLKQNRWRKFVYEMIDEALMKLGPSSSNDITVSSVLHIHREQIRNDLVGPLCSNGDKIFSDFDSIFENTIDVFMWKVEFLHIMILLSHSTIS